MHVYLLMLLACTLFLCNIILTIILLSYYSIGEFGSKINHKIVSKESAQFQATLQESDGLSSLDSSIELQTIENTKMNTSKMKISENDKTFDQNAVLLSQDTSARADSTQIAQPIEHVDGCRGGRMDGEEEQKEEKRKEKEEKAIDLDLHVGGVGGVRGGIREGGTVIVSEDDDVRDKRDERTSGERRERSVRGQKTDERLGSKRTEERVRKERAKGRVNQKRKQKIGGERRKEIAGEGRREGDMWGGGMAEMERGRGKRWEDKEDEESREEEGMVKLWVESKDRRRKDEESVSQKSCERSEKQFQEKDSMWLGERECLVSIDYNADDKEESRNSRMEEGSENRASSTSIDSETDGTVEHFSTEETELPSPSVTFIPPPESGRQSVPHQDREGKESKRILILHRI